MVRAIVLLAVVMLAGVKPGTVWAQSPDCGSYATADRFFREIVGASLVWIGRVNADARLELRVLADKGRPWVLLAVRPANDYACVIDAGNNWETIDPWPKGAKP